LIVAVLVDNCVNSSVIASISSPKVELNRFFPRMLAVLPRYLFVAVDTSYRLIQLPQYSVEQQACHDSIHWRFCFIKKSFI
jgi:hypothetical protein